MSGFIPLLLLFVFIPLAELYLLIEVGGAIGGLTTILLCLATAGLGAWLVRSQGFQTFNRAQQNLAEGQIPAVEMFEGAFIALAGALLLVPGLITDLIGFACLIPALRRYFIKRFMGRARSGGVAGGSVFRMNTITMGSTRPPADPQETPKNVVDADFKRLDDD